MSKANETVAATREELTRAVEVARTEWSAKSAAACETIEQLFQNSIFVGFGGVGIKISDCERFTLYVESDGRDDRYTIELNYDDLFNEGKRTLRMNVGSHGSFDSSKREVALFYALAGKVASRLEHLDWEMAHKIDWDGCRKAKRAYYDARWALREEEDKAAEAARAAAVAEAAKLIVPGAVLQRRGFASQLVVREVKNKVFYYAKIGRAHV